MKYITATGLLEVLMFYKNFGAISSKEDNESNRFHPG
jgi:hypothetical protein